MYKLYILIGLIAVIVAQRSTSIIVTEQEVEELSHVTDISVQDMKNIFASRFTTCISNCIYNKCGKTDRSPRRLICRANHKIFCQRIFCEPIVEIAKKELKDRIHNLKKSQGRDEDSLRGIFGAMF
jgi:hypothetical protein